MSAPDVRAAVEAGLRTVQGTKHHLGFITLQVLTDRVTEAVAPLVPNATPPAVETEMLPKADVVAWLVKKAREETPVWLLASKVERGAIRPDNLRMLPADFFEPGHTYVSGTWKFRCETVSPSPGTGERRALGWKFAPVYEVHRWHAVALDPDDWAHGDWTDVTAGGESR